MAIFKQQVNNKVVVTFKIPIEISKKFSDCSVVGDFNNWNPEIHKLRKANDKSPFILKIELESNGVYEFMYLFNDGKWDIDPDSDGMVPNTHGTMNCVLKT